MLLHPSRLVINLKHIVVMYICVKQCVKCSDAAVYSSCSEGNVIFIETWWNLTSSFSAYEEYFLQRLFRVGGEEQIWWLGSGLQGQNVMDNVLLAARLTDADHIGTGQTNESLSTCTYNYQFQKLENDTFNSGFAASVRAGCILVYHVQI